MSGALPTGVGSMDSMVSVSDKSGRHILQDFLRKVLRLAANRLHDLCGRLDLQDANREEIETQVHTCSLHCYLKVMGSGIARNTVTHNPQVPGLNHGPSS